MLTNLLTSNYNMLNLEDFFSFLCNGITYPFLNNFDHFSRDVLLCHFEMDQITTILHHCLQ